MLTNELLIDDKEVGLLEALWSRVGTLQQAKAFKLGFGRTG
jgi:hypothetical protein